MDELLGGVAEVFLEDIVHEDVEDIAGDEDVGSCHQVGGVVFHPTAEDS